MPPSTIDSTYTRLQNVEATRSRRWFRGRWLRCWICVLSFATGCLPLFPARAEPTSPLTLRSSSPLLTESFGWAKQRALSYVRTGQQPENMPCYFAAMSDSEFCVRDVAHMMEGAHLLGLDVENWSMMRLFAWGANRRLKQDPHWPRWHYPYAGKSAENFGSCQWRTLPAPFDMAWRCYEQYLWTGDERWIHDAEMFTFHTNLHTKFMKTQRWDDNPVADELTQLASYYEFPRAGEHFIEAGDAIGCQYQALLAYAAILNHKGNAANATRYRDKAAQLRAHFETCWFDTTTGRYIRGFDRFTNFRSDWGRENSYFMPMTLITDQGPRTAAYLDFIDQSISKQPLNIEAYTYIPEVFYKHGRNETAWKYLKHVMKTRSGYPEVSFTCVGNTIAGLMGVTPDAPQRQILTLPRLPKEIAWVAADHVKVGQHDLLVRHQGNQQTILRNNAGPDVTWQARFYGHYPKLRVDGAMRQATVTTLNGRTISVATVNVAAGQTSTVEATGDSQPDLPSPPAPRLQPASPPAAPAPGTYSLSDMRWRYGASNRGSTITRSTPTQGGPVGISGVAYAKGISAPVGSAIRYDVHRHYSRFLCDVGFDDAADNSGSVEVVVYGGRHVSSLRYTSGVLHARPNRGVQHINIDVGDCDYIVLGVKDAGDASGGTRVNWADARLIAKGGTSDDRAPTAPAGLRATVVHHNRVHLEWQAAQDNTAVRGYDIYHGTLSVGSTGATRFQVRGLDANQSYQFSVKAWDAAGNTSAASPGIRITTPLAPDRAYLSELNWQSATTGFGSVTKDRSVGGKPLRLNGTRYERGIGTHANSEIVYDLGKLGRPYARFTSDIGVDDEISAMATVTFQVFADDKKVFDSGVMTPASATQTVDVNIAGVKELRLVVNDASDGINSDHADWAGARLVTKGEQHR